MPAAGREWRRIEALGAEEKAAIAARCERLVAEVLTPRHLPEIRVTAFNYPVAIFGRWRGSKYSFVTRYRSGFEDNAGEEFDAAFARLDHVEASGPDALFDVMWHRHTGQWFRLYAGVPLDEALRLVETDGLLSPHI